MPQFDKITFFNQIMWLLLIFLTFYLALLKLFLPSIGALLKARKKKLNRDKSFTEFGATRLENDGKGAQALLLKSYTRKFHAASQRRITECFRNEQK